MRKYKQITKEQRIRIDTLLKTSQSKTEIAQMLGLHRSAVYRELKRNAQKRGGYNAITAHELSAERKERFGQKRKLTLRVKKTIEEKLKEEWSPEQITGYCRKNRMEMVSHETIYQFIYEDKRQGGCLHQKLRIAYKPYRKRYGTNDRRGKIPDRISIEQRPAVVNDRQRIGDWEADTIVGKRHQGAVLTLVERKTYFTLLGKLERATAANTRNKLINLLASFKDQVHTITSDNGHEFAEHKIIAAKLSADFYFTHPYSAWEKAINENTNGLIRQYLPKSTNLKETTVEELKRIENKLNNRPRKSLQWNTPLQAFFNQLNQNNFVALGT